MRGRPQSLLQPQTKGKAEPGGAQAVFWTLFWSIVSTGSLLKSPTNLESIPCRQLGLGQVKQFLDELAHEIASDTIGKSQFLAL